ncbi:MAG: hypothetical protein ABSE35_17440 [Bryobacteraceae bacterium]
MDLNLDTLKREILEYLDSAGFAVFHNRPGGLEGLGLVLWDTEKHPDFQAFLDVAQKCGAKLILFASAEFESSDIEELEAQLDDCDLSREERREYESRLHELRVFTGLTCSLELAFDHDSRLYVYELQPDWYDEFGGIEDEIMSRTPEDDEPDSLPGYFSKN